MHSLMQPCYKEMSKLRISSSTVRCVASISPMSNRSESGNNGIQDDESAVDVVCSTIPLVCSLVVMMGMPS